jgi:hypothetical protein
MELPKELWAEVLSLLKTNQLTPNFLGFRLVSKQWNSIILELPHFPFGLGVLIVTRN